MPDGASENKVRPTRNSGDAYGYSMYRKLLPKFLDMIDMSLLDDESKEPYKQGITSRFERTSKSADSTKKCSNDSFHKTLYFNGKSFCALNGIYYFFGGDCPKSS